MERPPMSKRQRGFQAALLALLAVIFANICFGSQEQICIWETTCNER